LLGTGIAQADDRACPQTTLKGVQDEIAQAYLKLQLVDYPSAVALLGKAEEAVHSVSDLVPSEVLANLFMIRGLTNFYLADRDKAEAAFLQAIVFHPEIKWSSEYGQRPLEVFQQAQIRYSGLPALSVPCPLFSPGVHVFFDGRELTQGAELETVSGTHFMQVQWKDGAWSGKFFPLREGEELVLPLPSAAILAIKELPHRGTADSAGTSSHGNQNSSGIALSEKSGFLSTGHESNRLLPVYVSLGVGTTALAASGIFGARYWKTRYQLEARRFQELPLTGTGQEMRKTRQALNSSSLAPGPHLCSVPITRQ
jgi:hypothetical protein